MPGPQRKLVYYKMLGGERRNPPGSSFAPASACRMARPVVKYDDTEHLPQRPAAAATAGDGGGAAVIDLSSSDSDSGSGGGGVGVKRGRLGGGGGWPEKRARVSATAAVPSGYLDQFPWPPARSVAMQFWKAGDYDGRPLLLGDEAVQTSGMDHVRVHPKFLHSNATSHKWALGALAELLDNSLDEVVNGATYVNIDMLENKKDGTRMLLVEDDGGGMDPDKMRQCMSLGYSAKSKVKNTIGQYGNGFKTSTMRLGADVLVFSRSCGKEGKRPTQSIGMLSYTFLRSTAKEDIVVPMIDYEKEQAWKRKVRTKMVDWHKSLETIIRWSPYSTEAELLQQFDSIKEQGTRIVIYNLWEDDQGELELDFDADVNDIQIRGANRDEKNIQMANQFPNSKHFLTYRHSLRSYASILYLRVPHIFRMILRRKEIEHHNIMNDMMLKQQNTYKPVSTGAFPKDSHMLTVVTIGFVKDAQHHIDVQGFNVYHKNRLIKPFWRVWTPAGSGGRGVIGVLEVNFIEPAHDKQDFERTNILSRLEAKLIQMQKTYWSANSCRIGYGGRANKNSGTGDSGTESSHDNTPCREPSSHQSQKGCGKSKDLHRFRSAHKYSGSSNYNKNGKASTSSLEASKYALLKQSSPRTAIQQRSEKSAWTASSVRSVLHDLSDDSNPEFAGNPSRLISHILKTPQNTLWNESTSLPSPPSSRLTGCERITIRPQLKEGNVTNNGDGQTTDDPDIVIKQLRDENSSLKERILRVEESMPAELQIERDKNKSLVERLEDVQRQLETAAMEQEALIDIFSEERNRRDQDEENLRKKLKEASSTIQDLLEQLSAARNFRKV